MRSEIARLAALKKIHGRGRPQGLLFTGTCSYEPILYGWPEGMPHYWCGARDQGDVWSISKPAVNDLHPTQKPVALIERAITNSTKPGHVVLDPFAGAGSTLIAAEKTARRARVIELAPGYVDTSVKRWQDFTGKKAVLAGAGRPFEQIAELRAETALAKCRGKTLR